MTGEISQLTVPKDYFSSGLRVRAWLPAGNALPPAVLLHGTVISGAYMVPLARALSTSMPVYVPDLPGLGRSSALPAPPTVHDCAAILADWMQSEALGPATIVGNSYGAQVASKLAVEFPDLVSALVLIGPTIDPTGRTLRQLMIRSAGVVATEPLPLHLLWLRDLGACGFRHGATYVRAALADHIEERLPQVSQPALVVRGVRDKLVSEGWSEAAAGMIPNGCLLSVQGAGHAAHYSRPAVVGAGILSLLNIARCSEIQSLGRPLEPHAPLCLTSTTATQKCARNA